MTQYSQINARPVKGFFVEMLTRDISVEDAILDLLDNCVDGILRSLKGDIKDDKPYEGYWAKIIVNKDVFQIEDNCGGIPWSEHDKAFRMGRPKNDQPNEDEDTLTVGVYGIGMKRAIFKMGESALIWTKNGQDAYEIPISTKWLHDEDLWDLEVNSARSKTEEGGTIIIVNDLYPRIRDQFSAEAFQDNLLDKIQSHYSVILNKGFQVIINNIEAKPKTFVLRFAKEKDENGTEIRPFMFRGKTEDVDVFLAIGLREPIPDAERLLSEQEVTQYSSDYAGWTVICNDRVVLYCNRDELTGWGTANVPRYHTQFIAISGVVEFRGNPTHLPTTTTKRGLDYSSTIYQQTLNRMRDGMRLFIDFTNKWKTREDEAKAKVSPIQTISYSSLSAYLVENQIENEFSEVRIGLKGQQYKPILPQPPDNSTDVRISYSKEKEDVYRLAEVLLSNMEELREKDVRRRVGETSFDFAFEQLIKAKDTSTKNNPGG